jgi:hypothetical protein
VKLESALDDNSGATYFFIPASGEIVFRPNEEGEQTDIPEHLDVLLLDPVPSHERFEWMEEFVQTVHSVTARAALGNALRQKKPFRQFKEALIEYPLVRGQWFRFQEAKLKQETVGLIESLDWEILEVADGRLDKNVPIDADPAARLAPTTEEREWILRGASEIAGKGGRSQLALLLKGSKDKKLLKHNLDQSPVYSKLSFLTIEEIENRIDHLIRKNDLRLEFSGDFPLIYLTGPAWEQVRPWSNEKECREAAKADEKALNRILLQWCLRRRREQLYLLESMTLLEPESAQRLMKTWLSVAGKEVGAWIEQKLPPKA